MTHVSERRSSGYSLDEAAYLRRLMGRTAADLECPRCGVPTERTTGSHAGGSIWFLHCRGCGRSVVIPAPETPDAG